LTGEVGMDGGGEIVEGAAALLAAGFDHGQHGLHETAAAGALRAEGKLAPDDGVTQRTLGCIVGRFDAFLRTNVQSQARCLYNSPHMPTSDALPLSAPRSSKRSTSRRTDAIRRTNAARLIVPSR